MALRTRDYFHTTLFGELDRVSHEVLQGPAHGASSQFNLVRICGVANNFQFNLGVLTVGDLDDLPRDFDRQLSPRDALRQRGARDDDGYDRYRDEPPPQPAALFGGRSRW